MIPIAILSPRSTAVCICITGLCSKLPGCVEGPPWVWILTDQQATELLRNPQFQYRSSEDQWPVLSADTRIFYHECEYINPYQHLHVKLENISGETVKKIYLTLLSIRRFPRLTFGCQIFGSSIKFNRNRLTAFCLYVLEFHASYYLGKGLRKYAMACQS